MNPTKYPINIAQLERLASGLGGVAMVGTGLMRALPGLTIAAAGVGLIARGACGHSLLYQKLGWSTARVAKELIDDPIVLRRSREVAATPSEVFALLRDQEQLPALFRNIDRIEDLADGKKMLHFRMGPVRFESLVTVRHCENESITWDAVPVEDDRAEEVGESQAPGQRELRPLCAGTILLSPKAEGTRTMMDIEVSFALPRPWMKVVGAALQPIGRLQFRRGLAHIGEHFDPAPDEPGETAAKQTATDDADASSDSDAAAHVHVVG